MKDRKTICIGIVAYDGLDGQVAEDYMRMMFYLGRRCPEWNFQLAIKWKSEQFRARNAIVKAGLQYNADYIWMLDDDHIIDTGQGQNPTDLYELPIKLANHLEGNPSIGVVGALYYQRGAECYPVIMQELDDKPFFILHAEVSRKMQKVDVTGGGCMMIRASVFDKINEPWFAPEFEYGTDIQLCKQVRKAGYEVWCDTSLEIGHLQRERKLITSKSLGGGFKVDKVGEVLSSYRKDASKYLGMDFEQICELAGEYVVDLEEHGDIEAYYASKGREQLARQVFVHSHKNGLEQAEQILSLFKSPGYGVDVGCGSAPVGFELALRGHKIDFIDLNGAGAYQFTKWRAEQRNIDAGFEWGGPYDYALFLDSVEHFKDWKGMLSTAIDRLKPSGAIVTNYFLNMDFNNPEHISMNHAEVRAFLESKDFKQEGDFLWVRHA